MIEILISSKTRIKLLMKFFLNSDATAYLRSLESEFGESSNAIRVELNRFEEAGMLVSRLDGNKKIFQANTDHPLFREVHNILLKQIGLDQVIENVIERLGEVNKVFVIGEFSKGLDNIEINYLVHLIEKVEALIRRKIRYLIYSEQEFENLKNWEQAKPKPLLLWARD
jgi:DNA-binding transcriptional ArsR family regulator